MITVEQQQQYQRDGYFIVRNLVESSAIAEIKASILFFIVYPGEFEQVLVLPSNPLASMTYNFSLASRKCQSYQGISAKIVASMRLFRVLKPINCLCFLLYS